MRRIKNPSKHQGSYSREEPLDSSRVEQIVVGFYSAPRQPCLWISKVELVPRSRYRPPTATCDVIRPYRGI